MTKVTVTCRLRLRAHRDLNPMAALAKLIEGRLHGLISEDEFVEAKSNLKNAALAESQP